MTEVNFAFIVAMIEYQEAKDVNLERMQGIEIFNWKHSHSLVSAEFDNHFGMNMISILSHNTDISTQEEM